MHKEILSAICLGLLFIAAESSGAEQSRSRTSRHLSQAIQENFRKDDGPTPESVAADPKAEVSDEITLPALSVTGGHRIDSRELTAEEPPKPVFGTGVTEFRGRRFTLKLRRILFIPVAFKIEW